MAARFKSRAKRAIGPLAFRKSVIESISALRMLNIILIMQAAVIGWVFMTPTGKFIRPIHPPDPWWVAPSLHGIELWEIIFPLGALFLAYATWSMKLLVRAHLVLGVIWGAFGLTWIVSGFTPTNSYTFYVGIIAMFIATQHVTMVRFWKVEA